MHAAAWKRLFDRFLECRAAATGDAFRPFDIEGDYLRYVDGKPRLDGVRDFLGSRGIVLPDGGPDDPPERETVSGLGNGKNALFREILGQKGVEVFEGSVAFIRSVRNAGLKTAVVSASKNTVPILSAAGLSDLFDARIDGVEAARLGLRGKPSPDTFLHAAKLLGVSPLLAFGVEDSLAGVEAIRAARFGLTIGVDRGGQRAALAAHGADVVVADLGELQIRRKEPSNSAQALQARSVASAGTDLPVAPSTDPEWILVEEGFTLAREHEVEVFVRDWERPYRDSRFIGRGKLVVCARHLHRWRVRFRARLPAPTGDRAGLDARLRDGGKRAASAGCRPQS